MTALKFAIREILGLFVDDEFLALATLAVVLLAAVAVKSAAVDAMTAGALLLGGCLVVLVAGVWRTAHAK